MSLASIALISDVHGNVPALEAVLTDIDARGLDAVYHLGDLVGYGPWPNEVVEMVRRHGVQGIAGNYDSTVAAGYKHCGCRYEDARQEELSHQSFAWTLEHTSAEVKRYLQALPFRLDVRPLGGHQAGPTITLLHGNQVLNTVYVTEERSDDFLAKMSAGVGAREGDIIAFGHTHKPWHRVVGGVHFVNTGSVGRPKDGDRRAGYVLLDLDANEAAVEFKRVEYDVERAADAIHASTLPNELAEYLRTGGRLAASV
ncbi:MAG TPA: metallophosphoesterase family protein [Gemmatimonadaceae bacterium]|jgi:predicted phosphodiesterase|nr:metallophosphoesterase family protein [Gemmatimonadaceae bacterium]